MTPRHPSIEEPAAPPSDPAELVAGMTYTAPASGDGTTEPAPVDSAPFQSSED